MTFPVETIEIKLSAPVPAADNSEITSITMREPTVRDRIAHSKMRGTEEEREAQMLADLCSLTVADLMNLTAYDYSRLLDEFNVFMLPPEKRGEKRLPKP